MRIKRRNGLVSALLGLVTCGLYHIFFWYQYGEDTNWVCRDDRKMTQNYIVAWILSWITCGIYGLLVHTRFLGDEIEARTQFDQMKNDLAMLVEQLPECEDGVPEETIEALDEFVHRYP